MERAPAPDDHCRTAHVSAPHDPHAELAAARLGGGVLTPTAVRSMVFNTVRLRAGYDLAEVDVFLGRVESSLNRLFQEINAPGGDQGDSATSLEARLILRQARERAAAIEEQARDKAEAIERRARERAEQILENARQTQRRGIEYVRALTHEYGSRLERTLREQLTDPGETPTAVESGQRQPYA